MFAPKIFLWLFALVVSTRAIGFRGFTYGGMKVPDVGPRPATLLTEKWIQQPLDHFNVRDNRTWSMRYYENDELFNGTGPVLIFLGGEWEIDPASLETGQMYEVAKVHGAIMYYTEHRYYGKSKPVEDTSAENLEYLSVDQALADVAYFIDAKKREVDGLLNASVIVFGCSYAGSMAAWARLKYPHLIQGALASSAPVQAQADFFEYFETVAASLGRYSEQCTVDVKNAFDTIEGMLDLPDGPDQLKIILNLCDVPKASSTSDVGYFMNALAEQFASAVQYNKRWGDNESTIGEICDKMMDTSVESPVLRLGKILSSDDCNDMSYDKFVKTYTNTSWDSAPTILRLWYYQTCTEYGYFQTATSEKSIFGSLVPLKFYTQMCEDLYGTFYNSKLLDSSVARTNVMYGGSSPDIKNIIFINGNIDPWHTLSVLEDLNDYSPAILVDGSSHCEDTYAGPTSPDPELNAASKRALSIIDEWLTSK